MVESSIDHKIAVVTNLSGLAVFIYSFYVSKLYLWHRYTHILENAETASAYKILILSMILGFLSAVYHAKSRGWFSSLGKLPFSAMAIIVLTYAVFIEYYLVTLLLFNIFNMI